MATGDIPDITFTAHFGIHKFLRAPLGLRSAAQTIHQLVDDVFRGLNFVHSSIYDCLISSPERESHPQQPGLVLERLLKHDITVNTHIC